MSKNPFIGQLDRKIQVVQETFTQNTMGEQKPGETVIANPWAYMEEAGGDEDVDGKIRHLIERKYTIRYNNNILANGHEYIIKDGALTFAIFHVLEVGRKKHIQLLAAKHE